MNSSQSITFDNSSLILKFLELVEKDYLTAVQQLITKEHITSALYNGSYFADGKLNEAFCQWLESELKKHKEQIRRSEFFEFIQKVDGWNSFSLFCGAEISLNNLDAYLTSSVATLFKPKKSPELENKINLDEKNKQDLNSLKYSEACSLLYRKTIVFAGKDKLEKLLKSCLDYKAAVPANNCNSAIIKKFDEFIAKVQATLNLISSYKPPALEAN